MDLSLVFLTSQSPPRRPLRRLWLAALSLLSLLCVGAGPPVLSGTAPGSPVLLPEEIAAHRAAQRPPSLTAASALLADSATQQPLMALDPYTPRPMASTTKIMTALLTLERARLDDRVVVPASALIGEASMGLQAGEVVTVEDLLWGLLLASGNDAALALAQHVAGSEAAFVDLMNRRAAELGLTGTRFANPHGLDADGHVSSAYDLWRLAEAAMAFPKFREIVASPTAVVAGRQLWNRNELLTRYPGADGIKTGTTLKAGQVLVASVTRQQHRAVAVVMGSQDRYRDAEALFDAYFERFRWASAPQPAGPTAWVTLADGRVLRVIAENPPDLFLPRWLWPRVRTQVIWQAPGDETGRLAGQVRWYLGNELLGQAPARLSPY